MENYEEQYFDADKAIHETEEQVSLDVLGVKRLMYDCMRQPILSPEEERELFLKLKALPESDKRAREKIESELVARNTRLVYKVARAEVPSFTHSMTIMDKMQEGQIGLLNAIRKFDLDRGCKFSTYATYWIRQAIQRGAANYGTDMGCLPAHIFSDAKKLIAIYHRIHNEEQRVPSIPELMKETGFGKEKVEQLLRAAQFQTSLDAIVESFNSNAGTEHREQRRETADSFVANDAGESLENNIENKEELKDVMELAKNILNERCYKIFVARRCTDKPETFSSIGLRLNLSAERVRQLDQMNEQLLKYVLKYGHLPELESPEASAAQ